MADTKRPQVHIEVRLRNTDHYVPRAEIEQEVYKFLNETYSLPVYNNEYLDPTQFDAFNYLDHVYSVRVAGIDLRSRQNCICFEFKEVRTFVHAYEPCGQQDDTPTFALRSPASAQPKIVNLPHESLINVWESLEFDASQNMDPEQLLSSIVRTVTLLHQPTGFPSILNVNRLVLFHGPPGCGKSTLCRALAHKLTIRLSRTFAGGKLFEINTQDLLSKYYSESGKLISDMFDKVLTMAQDEKQLICVLIDEVESIAASRQHSTQNGECADTMRATNQLLTALDRIRSKPNIVVFCTSNLLQSIDTAFLDRLYIAVTVPPPGLAAIYTILSSTLNALIDAGAILCPPWPLKQEELDIGELFANRACLPSWTQLPNWEEFYPDSPGPRVKDIARDCKGLSGRRLRKLPLLAITKYAWEEKCSLDEAIAALEVAVRRELAADYTAKS